MTREALEKLGSIFLAVFSTGLSLVMAAEMGPTQRVGAIVAVAASLTLAAVVRTWRHPEQAKAKAED